MTGIPRVLAHLPFFEALASLDDSSEAWRSCSAGLLTLRLLDLWREQERGGLEVGRVEVAVVREAVEALASGDLSRPILAGMVDGAEAGGPSERVLPQLMAYGRVLQLDARWPLAAHVFAVLLDHPASAANCDLAVPAALQRAYCLRMAGDLDAAERAYADARGIATGCGDAAAALRVEVGRANLAVHRGNLPRAETLLDDVIGQAERAGCEEVLSRALHDRGNVAYRRGRREDAVVFVHRALECAADPTERDRLLADIATIVGELGFTDAARDANLVVAETAQEQSVRWVAQINLLELAVGASDESTFERHRRELENASLPPTLRTHYLLRVAEGHRRFGRAASARATLEEVVAIAQEFSVNEALVEADRQLRELGTGPIVDAPAAPAPAVALVLQSLRTLRLAAQ